MSTRLLKTLGCFAVILVQGCSGSSSEWTSLCRGFQEAGNFPYSSTQWIDSEPYEIQREAVGEVRMFSASVLLPSGIPDVVSVNNASGVISLEITTDAVEFTAVFSHVGPDRAALLDEMSNSLSVDDAMALQAFTQLNFGEQVTWYREFGQSSFSCEYDDALRDSKKFLFEYLLQGFRELRVIGRASVGADGLFIDDKRSRQSLTLSESGWLVLSTLMFLHGEGVSMPIEQYDISVFLSEFERYVLNSGEGEYDFPAVLQGSSIDFNFFKDGVQLE